MIALRYLETICKEDDIVLLHDAVRPLITEELITDNIESVKKYGNAITAVPFTETAITSQDGENVDQTIIRNTMFVAKAPQSFYFKDVLDEKYKYRTISAALKGVVGPENKTHGDCPKCHKNIPLISGDECECPKCGGELRGFIAVLYD